MNAKLRTWAGVVALAVVAVACAERTPTDTGSGESIAHATASEDLLLKVEHVGGFVPIEYTFTNVPAFALYGDGTVIQPGAQAAIYPGPALPALFSRTLSEDGIQAVLQAAVDAGLGSDAEYTDLGAMGIADASTTVFTLTAEGTTSVVKVYALGFEGSTKPEGMPQDEFEARVRLLGLLEGIGEVSTLVPAGSLSEEGPYVSQAAKILVHPRQPNLPDDELPQEPKDWPLAEPLAGFGEPADTFGQGYRCGVVEGEDWVQLRALAREANERTPWISRDEAFALVFRPLLPDEPGC